MFSEEHPLDGSHTLHVIGRTYAAPHKYFYRRFASGTWSPWEPVGVDVEGDHVVAVVWRERLHLFWLTFKETAETNAGGSTPKDLGNRPVKGLSGMRKHVEISLNWSDYVDGSWTPRAASKTSTVIRREITETFDAAKMLVFVGTEVDWTGTEQLHVYVVGDPALEEPPWLPPPPEPHTGPGPPPGVVGHGTLHTVGAFRLATKNSPPVVEDIANGMPPVNPYGSAFEHDATLRASLRYALAFDFVADDRSVRRQILGTAPFGDYRLLLSDNRTSLPKPEPAVVSPFFYQDEFHTFFVEPDLVEHSFLKWDGWGVDGVHVDTGRLPDDYIELESMVPDIPRDPRDPRIDPHAKYSFTTRSDWVTNPGNVVTFDGVSIGREGSAPRDRGGDDGARYGMSPEGLFSPNGG
jgi:hypothetical protein